MDRCAARNRQDAAVGHVLNHSELDRITALGVFPVYRLAGPQLKHGALRNRHRTLGVLILRCRRCRSVARPRTIGAVVLGPLTISRRRRWGRLSICRWRSRLAVLRLLSILGLLLSILRSRLLILRLILSVLWSRLL